MSVRFSAFALVAAMTALSLPGAATAQPAPDPTANLPHETIIVYAPYVVTRQVVNPAMSRKSSTGLELVSASRTVRFGDLDLSKPADATILENRVQHAARDACEDIERHYPKATYHPVPANQDCVGNAVKEAMMTVKQVEAAAGSN